MAYTITDAQAVVIDRIARSLVGKQVKNHFIPESDKEDYVQELLLIMVQHQVDWNVPEKVCFETFVTMVMKKRLISIWRGFHAEKEILSYASSLNIIQKDEDGQDEELVDELAENGTLDDASLVFHEEKKRMLRHDIPAFLKTLPDDEREVCELLMQYGLRRTANIMGKHKFSITRKIHRIRRKIRPLFHTGNLLPGKSRNMTKPMDGKTPANVPSRRLVHGANSMMQKWLMASGNAHGTM